MLPKCEVAVSPGNNRELFVYSQLHIYIEDIARYLSFFICQEDVKSKGIFPIKFRVG